LKQNEAKRNVSKAKNGFIISLGAKTKKLYLKNDQNISNLWHVCFTDEKPENYSFFCISIVFILKIIKYTLNAFIFILTYILT